MVKSQVKRGIKLVSNVNTLSELDEHSVPLESIDIQILLENSINFINDSFKERKIKIELNSIEDVFIVQANQLLREVFDNILINSIKYNENHTIFLMIKLSRENLDQGKFIRIEFIDNGIGVDDNRKQMIFKRGNRELKGSKGMGIGLSLVKKILMSYNGKIWVEDKVNGDHSKGSKFILLIPEATKC